MADNTGDHRAMLSKMKGYVLRMALVLHMTSLASGEHASDDIDLPSMESAITLIEWHIKEAERVYATLYETDEDREYRRLEDQVRSKGGAITVRQLARSSRYATADDAQADLQSLVDAGRGRWEQVYHPDGGRPTQRLVIDSQKRTPVDKSKTPRNGTTNGGFVTDEAKTYPYP